MKPRTYTGKKIKNEFGVFDSKQEFEIFRRYPRWIYHPIIEIDYIVRQVYKPDFRLGIDRDTGYPVYLEAKEYFSTDMVVKYLSIVDSNSGIILLIMTPNISERDRLRLCGHPRIDVCVTKDVLPVRWLERVS